MNAYKMISGLGSPRTLTINLKYVFSACSVSFSFTTNSGLLASACSVRSSADTKAKYIKTQKDLKTPKN